MVSHIQAQLTAAQAAAGPVVAPGAKRKPKGKQVPTEPPRVQQSEAKGPIPDKQREPPGPPKPPPLGWDRPGRYAGEFYRMYSRRYVVQTEAQAQALDELFYQLIKE